MNVFLTGATGFVGSFLADALLRQGHRVFALVRGKPERVQAAVEMVSSGSYRAALVPVPGDVTAPGLGLSPAWRAELRGRIDSVIHAAGCISFRPEDRDLNFATNLDGTRHVVETVRELGWRDLWYVSTAYVCGKGGGLVREEPVPADAEPNNGYEASKQAAERFVLGEDVPVTIVRPSIVVGALGSDHALGLAPSFFGYYRFFEPFFRLKAARSPRDPLRLALRLLGDPQARINLVPADALAQMFLALWHAPASRGGVYHLCHPDPPRYAWLVETTLAELGITGVDVIAPDQLDGVPLSAEEQHANAAIAPYRPYVDVDRDFDQARLRPFYNTGGVPPIDRQAVHTLIGYAAQQCFGRAVREPTARVGTA